MPEYINPRDLLKHERLAFIKKAGLNTIDHLWYPPGELNREEIKELFDRHGRITFRQYTADPLVGNLPELFDVKQLESLFDFEKKYRRKDAFALINQGVDLVGNAMRGCMAWLDSYNYEIEYWVGEGNPRAIEKKTLQNLQYVRGDIDYGPDFQISRWDGKYSGMLKELAIMTRGFMVNSRPIIIEFEYHNFPLGWKPSNWIIWEWRKDIRNNSY